jgi:5-methylcytosine-specific restriction endonuclease McrA
MDKDSTEKPISKYKLAQLRGAAAADGAVLQIDHVHPASKGGPTTLDNLVAACQPCNNGKRDRVLAPEGGA